MFLFNGQQKFHFFLSFRHKILNMLTKNPPFTKNMESPLCNEALVDQLWKLMNSGETAMAFSKCFIIGVFSFYNRFSILIKLG